MKSGISCDVLVVGGGPAGSAAAAEAAAAGADVILIEHRRQIGFPAQCAGFIPAAVSLAHLPEDVIGQRVETMLTFTPDGHVHETGSPGYVVHRDRFDQALAAAAARAGARVVTGIRAVSHEQGITSACSRYRKLEILSAVVIGADGPRSTVGSWMGSVNTGFAAGIQWTVPLKQRLRSIMVFFDQEIPGGYGWLFPRGKEAVVGIAMDRRVGVRPHQALKWFVGKVAGEGLVDAQPLAASGGLIPISGPLPVHGRNMVLAGDAAGLCHPVTGAGVAMALASGRLAGEAAAISALGGGRDGLAAYGEEIESLAGESLRLAAGRQRAFAGRAGGSVEDYCHAVRQMWIAFPGYREADRTSMSINKP